MNSRFAAAFVRGGQHGQKRFDLARAHVARMQRRAIFVIQANEEACRCTGEPFQY
jgi:hypothetical protein